jgi:alanine-glyoxylate transaminase/serine-glyoxylate transaminase/serine-pyruvate transaminase
VEALKDALKAKKYAMITITQVDTSTAVLADVKEVSEIVRSLSPSTLIVVDGVCSIGSEELRMDEWGVDVVLTASQKALGAPPGLSVVVASKKAMVSCAELLNMKCYSITCV